ncbi:hypothetical protein NBH00_21430 [Paraconexibacter antarcticus]|uniref:HEAT repeat protein n=1 Tax=Paraconexibacter antarcticus TaxID=2949664 RepID=A0ABY5DPC4_9ACTN|nr:hypothetical protein [Paraconexibacter antarcticus]UTI63893.1 hypothetical protein NBH00_21430 [Paraconexibacter antarcticus]
MNPSELIAPALAEEWDSDERWAHIRELHHRGDPATYDAAMRLLQSELSEEREMGVDILAQLGTGQNDADRPYREPTVDFLIDLLGREQDPRVLDSATTALGHLHADRAVAAVAAHFAHPDPGVGWVWSTACSAMRTRQRSLR